MNIKKDIFVVVIEERLKESKTIGPKSLNFALFDVSMRGITRPMPET